MSICHLNVRSLNSSFDHFANLVSDGHFDIISLSETWLYSDFPSSLVDLPGYNLERFDRPSRGGGTCVYLKSHLKYKVVSLDHLINNDLEQLWVIVKMNALKIGVGTIYRAPHLPVSSLDDLELTISDVTMECDEIVIAGDINIDLLANSSGSRFLGRLLDTYNLTQIVTEPTRITEDSAKLLDVICVSKWTCVSDCGTWDAENISDHRLVYCTLNHDIALPDEIPHTRRNFRYFDDTQFASDASRINWHRINELNNVDDKVRFFTDAVTLLFDIHAPEETVLRRRRSKPYITETIKKMISLKNKAYRKYIKTSNENDRKAYKDMHNIVSKAIKEEKRCFILWKTNQLKNNSRKLWSFFAKENIHNRARKSISPVLSDVNIMNNHFTNIVSGLDIGVDYANFYRNNLRPGITEEFRFRAVAEEDIRTVLCGIKSDACGMDAIDLKMLQICFPFCKAAFTNIINFCLESGTFPTLWKKSIIVPLAKVTNATELSQLRPISILPTASKILEYVVNAQLGQHLERFHILPSMQSGFRKGLGTTTALLKVTNDLTSAMDRGMASFLLLLDYSKAFDCLNHELLLAKLKYFGLDRCSLSWFAEYLSERCQCVKYENKVSSELRLRSGVPQGSILGPTLFSMYTFDLPYFVSREVHLHLYADDTQVYISFLPENVNVIINKFNCNLANIAFWSRCNGLKINPSKTECICVATRKKIELVNSLKIEPIVINEVVIAVQDTTKNLGVVFDSGLQFDHHVRRVISCCYAKFASLYKYKLQLQSSVKWRLMSSLILSHIDYCNCVYFSHLTQGSKRKLQILQNNCMRFSFDIRRREHITPYYNRLSILRLEGRSTLLLGCLLFNVLRLGLPRYLYVLLVRRHYQISRCLRTIDNFALPKFRSSKYCSCFTYVAAKTLNCHINLFDGATSINCFRRSLRDEILSRQ